MKKMTVCLLGLFALSILMMGCGGKYDDAIKSADAFASLCRIAAISSGGKVEEPTLPFVATQKNSLSPRSRYLAAVPPQKVSMSSGWAPTKRTFIVIPFN